jgi:hypothetical protein
MPPDVNIAPLGIKKEKGRRAKILEKTAGENLLIKSSTALDRNTESSPYIPLLRKNQSGKPLFLKDFYRQLTKGCGANSFLTNKFQPDLIFFGGSIPAT